MEHWLERKYSYMEFGILYIHTHKIDPIFDIPVQWYWLEQEKIKKQTMGSIMWFDPGMTVFQTSTLATRLAPRILRPSKERRKCFI